MQTNFRSDTTPAWVAAILATPATWWLARIALTLPYWWSGIDKALHPQAAIAEIAGLNIAAPALAYAATLVVQLGGSLAIIANRYAWLGAGALAIFTAVVTAIAHAFWNLQGAARFAEMNTFLEHVALSAGFVYAAMYACAQSRPATLSTIRD
jgi:uncharacterized membrane protein YphA (DoxX/SURF4 family)